MNEVDFEAVKYQIELIDRANQALKRHQEANSGDLMINQYKELKKQYAVNLLELLEPIELPLQLIEA